MVLGCPGSVDDSNSVGLNDSVTGGIPIQTGKYTLAWILDEFMSETQPANINAKRKYKTIK